MRREPLSSLNKVRTIAFLVAMLPAVLIVALVLIFLLVFLLAPILAFVTVTGMHPRDPWKTRWRRKIPG